VAFPDLSNAVRQVEKLMADTVIVTRDQEGYDDATMDETTGRMTNPPSVIIYEGKGKVRPSSRAVETTEGGVTRYVADYECAVPKSADEIRPGDHLEVTDSARDTLLIGKRFQVTSVEYSTLLIQRKFRAELATVGNETARPEQVEV
jgi:hypothetical protein